MKPAFRFQWTSLIGLAEKRLLALTLAALLCWRMAGWTWYFFAPPARPVAPELRGEVNLGTVSRLPWFGVEPVIPKSGPAVATDLKIVGLYAGGNRPAALIAVSGQNAAAFGVGDGIVSGIRLTHVETDHVLIERNGVEERINLLVPIISLKPENSDAHPNQENIRKETPKK